MIHVHTIYTSCCFLVAVCPAGSFSSKNQCSLCPLGRYQPARGQSRCLRCPSGQTTLLEGSRRPSDCVEGNVNECQTSITECGPNEDCQDTPEYYSCDCKEGFTRQDSGNCTGIGPDDCHYYSSIASHSIL